MTSYEHLRLVARPSCPGFQAQLLQATKFTRCAPVCFTATGCSGLRGEETICEIIRIKNSRPRWGAKKIYADFCRFYPARKDEISLTTIDRLLARSAPDFI